LPQSSKQLDTFAHLQGSPKLLISARDVKEAITAALGGADIIDIKDPSRGSLGGATIETIRSISQHEQIRGQVPVTAALGELNELDVRQCEQLGNELQKTGLCLVKVGTSGFPNQEKGRSLFFTLHRSIERHADSPRLMPAAYADAKRAEGPSPWNVLSWAKETTARFLLVDTFLKDGRGFFSWIGPSEYVELLHACRESSVRLAVAGSLREADFEILLNAPPEVIAVRGAACTRHQRESAIDSRLVQGLRQMIQKGRTVPSQ